MLFEIFNLDIFFYYGIKIGIFKGNEEKICKWFNLQNAQFGGSAPKTIILTGCFHKIKNFIYSSQKR